MYTSIFIEHCKKTFPNDVKERGPNWPGRERNRRNKVFAVDLLWRGVRLVYDAGVMCDRSEEPVRFVDVKCANFL